MSSSANRPSQLPRPPRCEPRPGPTLQHHGRVVDRPYDWLKNIDSDPAVAKYLRAEEQYSNIVLKQLTGTLRATLEAELDDRAIGGDAQIPQEAGGYYYYECDESDADDDDESAAYFRVPKRPNLDLISDFSKLFDDDASATIRHPRGAQKYFDLNRVTRRMNATYSEQEDIDISPNGSRVVVAVDFTCGAEDCTVIALDIASQRQICTVAPGAKDLPTPLTLLSKKKKKKHNSINNSNVNHQKNQNHQKNTNKNHNGNNNNKGKSGSSSAPTTNTTPPPEQEGASSQQQPAKKSYSNNSALGLVVDSIARCSDMCLWLDDDTFAFVELDGAHRSFRVWAQTIPPAASTSSSSTPTATGSAEQKKKSKKKREQQQQQSPPPGGEASSSATTTTSNTETTTATTSDTEMKKIERRFGHSLNIKQDDDPDAALESIFNVLRQYYHGSSLSPAVEGVLAKFARDLHRISYKADGNTRSPGLSPAASPAASAPPPSTLDEEAAATETREAVVMPASSSSTTTTNTMPLPVGLKLLYEELDPCMEISGLYQTSDSRFLVFVSSTTSRNVSFVMPMRPLPDNFSAAPFFPLTIGKSIWLDHDSRPVCFFLSGGVEDDAGVVDGGDKNGVAAVGGSWFITHNLDGDGSDYRIDICSDQVNHRDRSNWHVFFDPQQQKQQQSAQQQNKSNTRVDVDPTCGDNGIIVEEVDCYKHWIVITVRRRGFQNLLLLDLSPPSSPSSPTGTGNESKKKLFSCPVQLDELIDIHTLLTDDEDAARHATTWVDLNTEGDYDCPYVRFTAHNVIYPDREYMLTRSKQDHRWSARRLLVDRQNNFNPNKYTVEVRHVPPSSSNDNNEDKKEHQQLQQQPIVHVPLLLVYRKDKFVPGKNPMLLYTYASYGDSHDPEYDATRVSLLNRGVVYACAMVRGGGEFGEAWRRAGAVENRPNTFKDFLACAEYALRENICNKICSYGESAGGCVVAAAMNAAPHLFAGVVARVPFVDCLATLLDPSLPLTPQEWFDWGNPLESEKIFDLIRSYSPVENVPPLLVQTQTTQKKNCKTSSDDDNGDNDDDDEDEARKSDQQVVFPNLYVESGVHDPRVKYYEPAIWVAKLRERWAASAAVGRVLVHKVNFEGGHDGAANVDEDRQSAQELAFICHSLGIQK